jgi:sodium/hydrogen exchanger 3
MSSTPRDDQQRSWGTTRDEGTPELEFFDDEYAAPYALKSSSNTRSFRGGEASRRAFEVGLSRENNDIDNAVSGATMISSRGGGNASPAAGAGAFAERMSLPGGGIVRDGGSATTTNRHQRETNEELKDIVLNVTQRVIANKKRVSVEDFESGETTAALSMGVMILMIVFMIVVSIALKQLKPKWVHASGASLMLGIVLGMMTYQARTDLSMQVAVEEKSRIIQFVDWMFFDVKFFFLVLLPPVVFEAGYTLHPGTYFGNADAIATFAFLGSFMNTFIVGGLMYLSGSFGLSYRWDPISALLFGSLITSTDPVTVLSVFHDIGNVDADLNAMILGESVLNDAVCIVLYEMFSKQVTLSREKSDYAQEMELSDLILESVKGFVLTFGTSMTIGIVVGMGSALLIKYVSVTSEHEDGWVFDTALVFLFPYLAYSISESMEMSGIVSVLFCGIVMGRYTRQNLERAPRMVSMCLFKVFAYVAETFVFIYMGASMYRASFSYITTGIAALLVVIVSRIMCVYPLSYLLNRTTRKSKASGYIEGNTQHMLVFCGLRGAVAYALSVKAAAEFGAVGGAMLTATTFLVLATVILQGAFMQPVMQCLGFGSADGEKGSSSKDENGSPNRNNNNNNNSYKEIGGGGDDEDDDDIPNVESLHPSSGKNNKAIEPMRQRSSSYHALEKFDAKYIQPWLMSEPLPSPNRILNGGKSGSHPNTPSRVRKGGKSSIATAQRDLSASDLSGRTKNNYNAESGERKPLLGEQTSKKSFSPGRTRGSTRGPLVFDAFGQHDRESSLASSVIEDSLRLPEYEREKESE